MKIAIITGITVATILIVGCGKKSPSSSAAPPPAQADASSSSPVAQPPERAIVTKAKSIVLPEFKLDGVTLTEAVRQLSAAAKQDDPSKGVNFIVMDGAETNAHTKISLDLKNVTLMEASERLAQTAGIFVTAEDYGFVFRPKTDLGAVELVVGKWMQFGLGTDKSCQVIATRLLPDAIHLKVEILSTNANGIVVIQSLREVTTPLGKQCDVLLGEDTMVSMIPRLKTP
jgi:hypothetical protein